MYYKSVSLLLTDVTKLPSQKAKGGKRSLKVSQITFSLTKVHFSTTVIKTWLNLFYSSLFWTDDKSVQSCFGRPLSMGNCSSLDQQVWLALLRNKSTWLSLTWPLPCKRKMVARFRQSVRRAGLALKQPGTWASGASICKALIPTSERAQQC